MAFENLRVQIAMLMDEIAAQPEDAHEMQERLREKLEEMKALGLPLPEDLVELEAALEEGLEIPPAARRRAPGTGAEEPEEA
jgi:hypothetical protein